MLSAVASACLIVLVTILFLCNRAAIDTATEHLDTTRHQGVSQAPHSLQVSSDGAEDPVPSTLEQASFIEDHAGGPSKTVIITTLNHAWAEGGLFDLFLESFHTGEGILHLLDHLVVVALDPSAAQSCRSKHKHCVRLDTQGLDLSRESLFMTPSYLQTTTRRIRFLATSSSFIYTAHPLQALDQRLGCMLQDADILWFRSPLPHFSKTSDVDLSCNHGFNGNSSDIANHVNGGLLHVRANPRTIKLYDLWYQRHGTYPGKNDQAVFEAIKQSSQFASLGLRIFIVPTNYLSGYCHMNADLETTCTMHAICCIGQHVKLAALRRSLDDWKLFRSMAPKESRKAGATSSVPRLD